MAVRLDSNTLSALKAAFMLFDYNKDGCIDTQDIGPVVRAVGLKPTESELKVMKQTVDDSNGGEVDLQTLVQLIGSKVTDPPRDRPEDLMEIFRMYDKEGRGTIRVQEMRHLLTTVGEKLTDDEAEKLLEISGCVTQDMVDYKRFVGLVMKG